MDVERLISDRSRGIDASGIRRVFELGAKLDNPANLSIGQPDFPVPERLKRAAVEAIEADRNGYTLTQGIAPLRGRIAAHLAHDLGWRCEAPVGERSGVSLCVTSGTSGGLVLAALALLGPGDEMIIPDPFFVMYPHVATMAGAKAVRCDTYPDFRMTAERVEPLITERTKFVIVNSPSNPAGVVLSQAECADLVDLCRRRGVLLISDEIYDEFTYDDAKEPVGPGGAQAFPSPARVKGSEESVLLIRGFGKTYGLTGWRLGYVAGPAAIVSEIAKLQQYTYVCAPTPLQWGVMDALDVDMSEQIADYAARRDLVVQRLSEVTQVARPGGAFYAFVKIPERLGIDCDAFIERCLERNVLVIPGGVFSSRKTHFRLSYATDRSSLERGTEALVELMG